MLSGIGPKEHLQSLGIDVIYNSPNVGKNLQVKSFFIINITKNYFFKGPSLSFYLFFFN